MSIGSFGDLTFEVSSERVFTYDNFQRESKSRYSKHELINAVPVLEWLGSDTETISFKMIFHAGLGVTPAEETARLRQLCLDGHADYLVLGDEIIGDNLWVIESVSEAAKTWDNAGNVLISEVEVKMVEYVAEVPEE